MPLCALLCLTSVARLETIAAPGIVPEGDPAISSGALGAIEPPVASVPSRPGAGYLKHPLSLARITVDKTFDSVGFDDNQVENINPATGTGARFIPPDPIGAVGLNRVVAVVNTMIEVRTKEGTFVWREGLKDFFAPVAPLTFTFDPKVVYDAHANRFVVVTLEQVTGTASVSLSNVSRILLAVSKSGNPKGPGPAQWNYLAIDAKTLIPRPTTPFDHWADYPGFEVDEEAIYVTANMFTFVPFGSFGGVRLWIVPKGAGTGGFYDGGPATAAQYNPYANGGIATTTMPAEIRGAEGAGPGVGTYLVSYSGLSDGVDEYIQVVRVDDPLGAPAFVPEFINIGNIETGFPALPLAPQAGSAFGIATNDRRALDAVWQNGSLWLTTTIRPNAGADLNQTTAHFVELDTRAVRAAGDPAGLIGLAQNGNIGGEDIAPGAFTFFPSVAVNRYGAAGFGFCASAPTIYAGAFVTGRGPYDGAGTVRSSEVVREGIAPYKRFFGGNRNRWGDYTGAALDPSNESFFWVFNQYADEVGSATVGSNGYEDGRWRGTWGRVKFVGGGR
jgi:hypothetical protein